MATMPASTNTYVKVNGYYTGSAYDYSSYITKPYPIYYGGYTAPKTTTAAPKPIVTGTGVTPNNDLDQRLLSNLMDLDKGTLSYIQKSYSRYTFVGTNYYGTDATLAEVKTLFATYANRQPTSEEISALVGYPEKAVIDYIFRYGTSDAAKKTASGGGSYGGGYVAVKPTRTMLEARARYLWYDVMGCIAPLPKTLLDRWISKDWLLSDNGILLIKEEIKKQEAYWQGSVAGTERILWQEDWEQKVGYDMAPAVLTELDRMLRAGYSRVQWQDWIEDRPEYDTGVEMMALRQNYLDALYRAWGIGQMDDILAANPNYIDDLMKQIGRGANYNTIYDWARKQPEWLDGPEAAASFENLFSMYTSILHVSPDLDWLYDRVADFWTPQMLLQYLRTTEEYQRLYAYKPAYMAETEWWSLWLAFNAVGARYYGEQGQMTTLTEAQVQTMREAQGLTGDALPFGVYRQDDGTYITWGERWEMSAVQLASMIDAGWTPGEWEQHLHWTEQAYAQLDNMNFLGEAVGRVFTHADAYALVSWGAGSGQLRALLQKAENRRAYDTVWALLNDGEAPTVLEYEWLEDNYLSPDHYYRHSVALQDAEAQFDQVDKLLRRIYGHGAEFDQLVNVNLNRPGSGAYEALIQAAEELDRYTLAFRLSKRRDPTPEEYAGFADMAGPDELEKEIRVRELMRAEGPGIAQIYNAFWVPQGAEALEEDDLEVLLGKYEGWGAIQRRLDLAEGRRRKREQSVEMSLRWGAAIAPISYTEFGGPKLPGLRRIGG